MEIGVLLGRHEIWVCRRLSLIERLSDEAQQRIRLGLLPASFGAELARLQRCNQDRLLESIRKHRLSWRETRKVVAALENSPRWEQDGILWDPRGVVIAPDEALVDPRDEKGLSFKARQIQQRLLNLDKVCLESAFLFSGTELGQFETDEEKRLRAGCARVLNSLTCVEKELRKASEARRRQTESGGIPMAIFIQNREEFAQRLIIMNMQEAGRSGRWPGILPSAVTWCGAS